MQKKCKKCLEHTKKKRIYLEMSPKSSNFVPILEKCIIMATGTMLNVNELAKKELLSLEEFKTLGHERLQQLIRTEVVC